MDNSINTLAKQGQGLADTAADKVQPGLRDAGATLSAKAEDIREGVVPAVRHAAARVQDLGKQGLDALSDVAGRAREAASSTSQSIIGYTKENPVKALLIAAASGAVLVTIANALKASRN